MPTSVVFVNNNPLLDEAMTINLNFHFQTKGAFDRNIAVATRNVLSFPLNRKGTGRAPFNIPAASLRPQCAKVLASTRQPVKAKYKYLTYVKILSKPKRFYTINNAISSAQKNDVRTSCVGSLSRKRHYVSICC